MAKSFGSLGLEGIKENIISWFVVGVLRMADLKLQNPFKMYPS